MKDKKNTFGYDEEGNVVYYDENGVIKGKMQNIVLENAKRNAIEECFTTLFDGHLLLDKKTDETKLEITHNSGGFGMLDIFYTEKLLVTQTGISFKRVWNITEDEDYKPEMYPKTNISWELKIFPFKDDMHNLLYEIYKSMETINLFERSFDSGNIEILITICNTKYKYEFNDCFNKDVLHNIYNALKPYIKGMPRPWFLKRDI